MSPMFVLQFNPPTSAAEYVHRVGRTARIGAQGNGLLFLTPSETAYMDVLANHNIRSVMLLVSSRCTGTNQVAEADGIRFLGFI